MNKATLYHSEFTRMGDVTIKVKSDVMASKFQGKPNFIYLEINGEERAYNIENERVEGRLLMRKGAELRVRAIGQRETADLEILSGNGERTSGHARGGTNADGGAQRNDPPAQNFNEEAWFSDYTRLLALAANAHEKVLPEKVIKDMSESDYFDKHQRAALDCLREKWSYKYWSK